MTSDPPILGQAQSDLPRQLHACVTALYPFCRSITGDGVRATLAALQAVTPITVHEVPTGTEVFDWTIPPEWNVRDAYVTDASGQRVIDFRHCNLHLLGYSVPYAGRLSLADLRPHLYALPEHPDWIPYRTSYYQDRWGFCLSQRQLDSLRDGEYEVCVDTTLAPGTLTYGEIFIAGQTPDEVLVSCHICHPSLANDNLSGIAVAAHLARHLRGLDLRYSYRFVFVPATIGALAWLARNPTVVRRIRHGLVLTCLGDPGQLTYKRSRRGNATVDHAAEHVLGRRGAPQILDFSPDGYDERQYCSPGFDLPVGRLSRTPHGRFPEYHTSADNLDFVRPEYLADSLTTCLQVLFVLEHDRRFMNTKPHGEPRLGKYGLYRDLGGTTTAPVTETALLWVLNLSDGTNSLLDIAARAALPFEQIEQAARRLREHDLLDAAP